VQTNFCSVTKIHNSLALRLRPTVEYNVRVLKTNTFFGSTHISSI
jgi:hypothetical protein